MVSDLGGPKTYLRILRIRIRNTGIYYSVYFQLDYEESAMPKESVEAMDDYPEAEAAGQHEDVEAKENNEDENSFLPVGLAIFFILGQLVVGRG
jgi:hypothetical protein